MVTPLGTAWSSPLLLLLWWEPGKEKGLLLLSLCVHWTMKSWQPSESVSGKPGVASVMASGPAQPLYPEGKEEEEGDEQQQEDKGTTEDDPERTLWQACLSLERLLLSRRHPATLMYKLTHADHPLKVIQL